MNTPFILALAAFALLARLAISFVQWFRSPLRSVPGPLLARFTDLWYYQRVKQGHFEKINLGLHEKHGPIVRYGPNRYSINDAESAKTIYGHGTQFAKSDWYSAWQPREDLWNLFAERSIKRHAHNRRYFSNAFSMSSLVHYEPYVDQCAALFSQRLTEFAEAGAPVDIGHWFQCFAFDTISMMTYGKRLGFLDCGDDIGNVIQALEDNLLCSSLGGIFPTIFKSSVGRMATLLTRSGLDQNLFVLNFTSEKIAEERASPRPLVEFMEDAGESFLSKFLTKHYNDPEEFTDWHILTGCAGNMFAGSDTTGISLTAILYYLLKNPHSMTRLREEIATFTNRGQLSESPTFKQTQEMPYFQAVIKEALRMHPAVGLPLERVVPKGGATIAGRFFPEGTVVGVSCWVLHQNNSLFGDDADQFRPERWLIADKECIAVMNRNWIPFGMGSRTCVGKNVSILEISKCIPRIVRDFDFMVEGAAGLTGGSWTTLNTWFVKPKNLNLTVNYRKAGI